MPGRAYTMLEMKKIVDYIKERKCFGETKGKNMWIDLSSSNSTSRTWQSLKETYLKRILPDIHNPYYRLTADELRSFRAGRDFIRTDRRLIVRPENDIPVQSNHENKTMLATDKHNGDGSTTDHKDKTILTTDKHNGDGSTTGEEPINKINDIRRDSCETVILDKNENCYQNAQDIIQDLESSEKDTSDPSSSPTKSLRDVFTYSEPLTPMVQEIVHDFDSDESNNGKVADINGVSSSNSQEPTFPNKTSDPQDSLHDKVTDNIDSEHKSKRKLQKKSKKSHKKHKAAKNMRLENVLEEVQNALIVVNKLKKDKEKDSIDSPDKDRVTHPKSTKELESLTVETTQGSQNTILTDGSIPNNQEALKKNYHKHSEIPLNSSDSNENMIQSKETQLEKKRKHSDVFASNKIEKSSNDTCKDGLKINSDNIKDNDNEQLNATVTKKLKVSGEQHIEPIIKIINKTKDDGKEHFSLTINDAKHEKELHDAEKLHRIHDSDSRSVQMSESTKGKKENISITANPCLKNVSLFVEKNVDARTEESKRRFSPDNVVLLNSHTDSDSDSSISPQVTTEVTKEQRSKLLKKMFGHSSEADNGKPERRVTTRSDSNCNTSISSESSSCSSDDETQFAVPPRRCRHSSKKYLYPGSCRILSLERDGGISVAYKGRMYPLIKEEKNIKKRYLRHMTYKYDKGEEDKVAYWRNKYFQERKKAQEVNSRRKEEKPNSRNARNSTSVESVVFFAPDVIQIPENGVEKKAVEDMPVMRRNMQTENSKDENAIKIKIHSDNKVIAIEGQPHKVATILADVMQYCNSGLPAKLNAENEDDVKKKISKMEDEIFKEIEEIDKKSSPEKTTGSKMESVSVTKKSPVIKSPTENADIKPEQNPESENVTNRPKRGRAKRNARELHENKETVTSPVRKKLSTTLAVSNRESEDEIIVNESKLQLVEDIAEGNRKPSPRAFVNMKRNTKRQNRARTDTDDARYKFPSPERSDSEMSQNRELSKKSLKKTKRNNSKIPTRSHAIDIFVNESSRHSVESTQDYQDSDTSPSVILNKRRRISFPINRMKLKFEARRRSFTKRHRANFYCSTSDSNLSSFTLRKTHSLLSTATGSTDSYQLLMAKKSTFKGALQKIVEVTPQKDEFGAELNCLNLSPATQTIGGTEHDICANKNCDSKSTSTTKTDAGNSSIVSLPLSPEISIVENISLMEVTPQKDKSDPQLNCLNLSPAPQTIRRTEHDNSANKNSDSKSTRIKTDAGNSSTVSLPLSPELSIVENISVDKNEILENVLHPTLNELQVNNPPNDISLHMSIVSKEIHPFDPLMEQDLDFVTDHVEIRLNNKDEDNEKRRNIDLTTETCTNNTVHMKTICPLNPVQDSLINRIRTVNINDEVTLSDSLNQKLSDLLLESTKKNDKHTKRTKTCNIAIEPKEKYKIKLRKRCSTPHKKTKIKKSNPPRIEPLVEEHMDFCAPKVRKSCPPSILINDQYFDINVEENITINTNQKVKKRRQKDIIKVKILKPKKKEKCLDKNIEDELSLHSDSGINNSVTDVFGTDDNDSINLIHNHSDTCLNANDCFQDNSVITENSLKSIISLNSDSSQCNSESKWQNDGQIFPENDTSDLQSKDDPDNRVFIAVTKTINTGSLEVIHNKDSPIKNKSPSENHSSLSYNSLITEDMSDETPSPRKSQWYLLSEDECSDSDPEPTAIVDMKSYLQKLFPIACAVPNLSTITEASREADAIKETNSNSSKSQSNNIENVPAED